MGADFEVLFSAFFIALSSRDLASRGCFFFFWTCVLYIFQFFFPQLAMLILLFSGHSLRCPFLPGQSNLLPHFFINNFNSSSLVLSTQHFWIRAFFGYLSAFDIIWWIWFNVIPYFCWATLVVWVSHVVLSLGVLFTILTVIALAIIFFLGVKILLWRGNNKCLTRLQLLFLEIIFKWFIWVTPAQEVIVLFMDGFGQSPMWIVLYLAFSRIICKTLFNWTGFRVLCFHISVACLFFNWPWWFVNFLHNYAGRFQTLLIQLFLPRARSLLCKLFMIGDLHAFLHPFIAFPSLRNTFRPGWSSLWCLSDNLLVLFLIISRSVSWNNTLCRTL